MPAIKTRVYKVKRNDCLWNIVKQQGFPAKHWKKIYNASYNAGLKKLRPNPNVIHKGDVLHLPMTTPDDIAKKIKKIKDYSERFEMLSKKVNTILTLAQLLESDRESTQKEIGKLRKKAMKEAMYCDMISKPAPGDGGRGFAVARLVCQLQRVLPLDLEAKVFEDLKSGQTKELKKYKSKIEQLMHKMDQQKRAIEFKRNELEQMQKNPYDTSPPKRLQIVPTAG